MSFKKAFHQIVAISVLFAGSLTSCSEEKIPEGIIPQEQLIEALVDVHIAESIYSQRYSLKLNYKNSSDDLYNSILQKHNVSDSIFASSIIYYSKQPDVYEKMYEKVMEKLNLKELDIKKIQDEIRQEKQKELDEENEKMKSHPDSVRTSKEQPKK